MKTLLKKTILFAALLIFALSLVFYPIEKAEAMLFPPLCFVTEMYGSEDKNAEITPEDILDKEKTEVKVRFRIVEIIRDLFRW